MTDNAGFSITIWVPPALEGGMRVITKSNWIGQVVLSTRSVTKKALESEFLKGTVGVYILIGNQDGTNIPRVYIGKGDPIEPRLLEHLKKRDFWEYFVGITRQKVTLDPGGIGYIEAKLLRIAEHAKRSDLENKKTESKPSMTPWGEHEMESFIAEALLCLRSVGITIFESPAKPPKPTGAEPVYVYVNTNNVSAKGYLRSAGGVIVTKGSEATSKAAPSMYPTYVARKAKLVEDGLLVRDGDRYRFVDDQLFDSPSEAADIVGGNHVNGWKVWKTDTGVSLGDLDSSYETVE